MTYATQRNTVSVVISTYNRPHLICNAVRSVLELEEQPLEIIIVDDNGAGSCAQIDTHNALTSGGFYDHPHIRYVPLHANCGVSAARNEGAARAKGRYIAFLSDDDLFGRTKLKVQVGRMVAHGWHFSACTAPTVDDHMDIIREPRDVLGGTWSRTSLMSMKWPCSYGIVVRTDTFHAVGGFDTRLKFREDTHLLYKMINYCKANYGLMAYGVVNSTDDNILQYILRGEHNAGLTARKRSAAEIELEFNMLNEQEQAVIAGMTRGAIRSITANRAWRLVHALKANGHKIPLRVASDAVWKNIEALNLKDAFRVIAKCISVK